MQYIVAHAGHAPDLAAVARSRARRVTLGESAWRGQVAARTGRGRRLRRRRSGGTSPVGPDRRAHGARGGRSLGIAAASLAGGSRRPGRWHRGEPHEPASSVFAMGVILDTSVIVAG